MNNIPKALQASNLVCVMLDIHLWSGRQALKRDHLIASNPSLAALPPAERPEHTEAYEGFFHLSEMTGTVDTATLDYIIRDHDMDKFLSRKALMETNFASHILPQGPIVFDATGQNKNANAVLLQVADKKIQVVWPTEYAMGKVIFPRKG